MIKRAKSTPLIVQIIKMVRLCFMSPPQIYNQAHSLSSDTKEAHLLPSPSLDERGYSKYDQLTGLPYEGI